MSGLDATYLSRKNVAGKSAMTATTAVVARGRTPRRAAGAGQQRAEEAQVGHLQLADRDLVGGAPAEVAAHVAVVALIERRLDCETLFGVFAYVRQAQRLQKLQPPL